MKYPIEVIQEFKEDFTSQKRPTFTVENNGRIYTCYELPKSQNPTIRTYTFHMIPEEIEITTVKNPEEYTLFAISEGTNQKVRDLILKHEIDEYVTIGEKIKGRCQLASKLEIQNLFDRTDLSEKEIADYINMRKTYFMNIIQRAATYSESTIDIQECNESLFYFEHLLK